MNAPTFAYDRRGRPLWRTDTIDAHLRAVNARYRVSTHHGEGGTVYYVVDTAQPEDEQPAVIHSWSTATEPNARYLALDFCDRHNAKEENQ